MDDEETYKARGQEFYKSNKAPVWPHRYRELPNRKTGEPKGPLVGDSYIQLLLNRLEKLEVNTRPSSGTASAIEKGLAAFHALQLAADLTEYVAGWAIDHTIGLGLNDQKFVPLQPSQTKQHPQYLAERAAADDHRHEKAGGRRDVDWENPLLARKALANILRAIAIMPVALQHITISALEALEFGERTPIFEPVKMGKKRDMTELRLQLRAVEMVAYREELCSKKGNAQRIVATALGVSPHTLRSWEQRLKNEFGPLEIERRIAFARNHASWMVDARKKSLRGVLVPEERTQATAPLTIMTHCVA